MKTRNEIRKEIQNDQAKTKEYLQHTPTPWAHHPTKWGDQIDHKIVGKDGRVLAIMNDSYLGVDSEQVGINAEFIVRAVNLHDAMQEELKAAREERSMANLNWNKQISVTLALIEAARYAICSDKCPHSKCQGLRDAIAQADGK